MEEKSPKTAAKRRLNGIVVSTKMQNTVVVRVDRIKTHPVYHKRYTTSKRYHCDYRAGDLVLGNRVVIEETRPISKTKHWRVIGVEKHV